MRWIRQRLAIRQTAYAVAVVAVLASATTVVEVAVAYQQEYDRVQTFVVQLVDAFRDTSARSAFHVDSAQAEAVLEGLMNFDTVAMASISTDLDELLAERSRTPESGYMDALSRWLFGDIAYHEVTLTSATTHVPVGTLALRISPELVGRSFLTRLGTFTTGLLIEFFILASVLAVVFHRTLIRPLTSYANAIEDIDRDAIEIPHVNIPRGHEVDELGQVVSQTNELLAQISEQREALIHREKVAALGSMLAGAAHELNNPLAVVSAQAQILKETAQDEQIANRAEKILKPAARCAAIVRSFLELAQQRKIHKAPAAIADVVGDAVELVAYRFRTHGIELGVSVAEDIPTLAVDAVQISQAVVNLLINAEQSMADQAPPRTVGLSVTFDGIAVVITVSDDGPGIPVELRGRVTEPFFTTKPDGRGTGLGLAFCSNVAASHQGSIAISERQPRGTVVTLTIKGERAELPQPHVASSKTTARRLSVLVVDDEKSLTESFAEALTIRGHSVETEFEGAEALSRLSTTSFDVVVADVRMPGIGGVELFEQAERQHPELADRFIFVTGEPVSEPIAAFLEARKTPCMSKPIDLNDLAAAVERRGMSARAAS